MCRYKDDRLTANWRMYLPEIIRHKARTRKMKTAVHLHLYYMEQLPEFISLLKNMDKAAIAYDLFVSLPEGYPDIEDKIRAFKPKAYIWHPENRGYDIGAFIDFLHKINLADYDYILKLHTKRNKSNDYCYFNGVRFNAKTWCRMLKESLLLNSDVIKENFSLLENNPDIGMIGSSFCLTGEAGTYKMLEASIKAEAKKLGADTLEGIKFIAGTMFIVRAKLMTPFLSYSLNDFALSNTNIRDYTLAHVLERLFGLMVIKQGYRILGVTYKKYHFERAMAELVRFLWQKKITKGGHKILKICRLPVYITHEELPKAPVMKEFSFAPLQKRRLAIYAAYDSEGWVDKADLYYIRALKEVADNVIYVTDNELIAGEAEKLSRDVALIMASSHGEYDFGSYKRGFFYAKEHNLLKDIDELIFCNDSCFAPVHPFSPVFEKMQTKQCDFWGITENIEFQRHIQSYFMVFRKEVFNATAFAQFMENVCAEATVYDVIQKYEIGLSKTLADAGFTYQSYIPYPQHFPLLIKGATNLTSCPVWMIEQGSPLVKKKSFKEKISNEEGFFKLKKTIKNLNPALAQIIPMRDVFYAIKQHYTARIKRFFYQKKHTKSGKCIVKICKIPVYSKKRDAA